MFRSRGRGYRTQLIDVKLDISARKRGFLVDQKARIRVSKDVLVGDSLAWLESACALYTNIIEDGDMPTSTCNGGRSRCFCQQGHYTFAQCKTFFHQ